MPRVQRLSDDFRRSPESPVASPWQAWSFRRLPGIVDGSAQGWGNIAPDIGGVIHKDGGGEQWLHRAGEVTFAPDQYQRLRLAGVGSSSRPLLCLRVQSDFSGGYHAAVFNGDFAYLRRLDWGTWTTLASASGAGIGVGAYQHVEMVGQQLSLRNANDTSDVLAATDATYAAGDATLIGLERFNYGVDYWSAGDIVSAGSAGERQVTWRGVRRGVGRGV